MARKPRAGPASDPELLILSSLASGPRHGYSIHHRQVEPREAGVQTCASNHVHEHSTRRSQQGRPTVARDAIWSARYAESRPIPPTSEELIEYRNGNPMK